MMSSLPLVVESISLDMDEFVESFLTCPVCLNCYDATQHSPKLLPCSHTICAACLTSLGKIATDSGSRNIS